MYNNLLHLEMMMGERVAWNLIALGDTVDLHSIHFHGQTVTLRTEHTIRLDVTELLPGRTETSTVYTGIGLMSQNLSQVGL